MHLPENTLETFIWAWSERVIPEADIRATSDNVIVCFHDKNLKRVCPHLPEKFKVQDIGQMTLAQVKTLDVGSYRGGKRQQVPMLKEVFAAMTGRPERFIFLDYKQIEMPRLVSLVKTYKLEKQVIFTTRDHRLIMQWEQYLPGSSTMIWIGGTQAEIAKQVEILREKKFKGIKIIQFHYSLKGQEYSLSDQFLTESKNEFTQHGILLQVLPLKIKESSVFEKLLNLGICSFATDYPESLLPLYHK
jgi:glycerophosphoryl diester phosphodiesterase